MKRQLPSDVVSRKRKKAKHVRELIDSEWNVQAVPPDDHQSRFQSAMKALQESEHHEDPTVLAAYTTSIPSIWNNRIITVKGPISATRICVSNFGASPPTASTDELIDQIVYAFENYVFPRLDRLTRVVVAVGLLMRIAPDEGLDQEHRRADYVNPYEGSGNAMYAGPDFNSQVFSLAVENRAQGLTDFRNGIRSVGDFVNLLMKDRESSKERFVFFTNFEIRTYHTVIPIVGARVCIPPRPEGKYRQYLWDPSSTRKQNVCVFKCIRYGLELHRRDKTTHIPHLHKMIKQYKAYIEQQTGERVWTSNLFMGIDMCANKNDDFTTNIQTSCMRLEDCFKIRLNLYAFDGESEKKNGPIPAYPLYISKKAYKGQPTIHLIMFGQAKSKYYHVCYLLKPSSALQGEDCKHCGVRFASLKQKADHMGRGHNKRKAGETLKTYPYGSFRRPLTVWEKMRMCCMYVPEKPPQPEHYVVFKLIVNTGMSNDPSLADEKGMPLYLFAKSTMKDRRLSTFYQNRTGPEMMTRFMDWLKDVQNQARTEWNMKIAWYLARMPRDRQDLANELQKLGHTLPVVAYDPLQLSSLMRYVVRPGIQVAFRNNRYSYIDVDGNLLFMTLLSYTGKKRPDLADLAGVPYHKTIFPYAALEEGNFGQKVGCNEETRQLFYHKKSNTPWEKQSEIDKWAKAYEGTELGLILYRQVEFELDTMREYIDTFAKTLREWVPDLNLFRNNTTAPALARYVGYRLSDVSDLYVPGPREGKRIDELFRNNMAGGPIEAYEKEVSDEQIFTYDANSLYPSCMMEDMPAGRTMFEFTGHSVMQKHGTSNTSVREHAWITWQREKHKNDCKHHLYGDDDSPVQHRRVGQYIVDGICYGCKRVYEFLGDYYHFRNEEKIKETQEKLDVLKEKGWTVVSVRERDFMKEHHANSYIQRAYEEMYPHMARRYMKSSAEADKVRQLINDPAAFQEYMMEELKDFDWSSHDVPKMRKVFGFVECDLEIDQPPDDKFSPLFIKQDGKSSNPMMGAKQVMFWTPYLAYLSHKGYKITNVYRFLEFKPRPMFKKFIQDSLQLRADSDGPKKMLYKLAANSMYGSTYMDKSRYNDTTYTNDDLKIAYFVASPDCVDVDLVQGTDYMRCTRRKKVVTNHVPIQLGLTILNLAKMAMARFFDHLKSQHPDMRLIYMDTDALTFSLPKGTELKKDPRWFDMPEEKVCGKFHLEAQGTHAVIVSKKVMTISSRDGKEASKVAHSGMRRECLPDDPLDVFSAVVNGELGYVLQQTVNTVEGDTVTTNIVKRLLTAGPGSLVRNGFK